MGHKELLDNWIAQATPMKTKDSKRRKHALLGQAVLKDYPSFQYKNVFVILDSKCDSVNFPQVATPLSKLASSLVQGWKDEFDDLKDEDHDGDDEMHYDYDPEDD